MPRWLSTILLLNGAAMLASCSTGQLQETRSPKAQKELAEALAGHTPGPPVRCIHSNQLNQMKVIDDWTILFKDGRTIYVQNPRGGCPGIGSHRNVLISRPMPSSQLCSGDIQQLFDPTSGIGGGACVFSEFVPYTKPAG